MKNKKENARIRMINALLQWNLGQFIAIAMFAAMMGILYLLQFAGIIQL